MQVVGMSFLYRDYGSASSFLVVKMFVRRPETFSLHHSLGWLLLPLLAGLWHGSNVGSDRPNVRSRLFGERLTEYYPSTQYSVTKNIRWHSSSQCAAMFKIIRISLTQVNYQVIILVEAAGAASSTLQYPTLENTNHEQALSLSFIDNFIIIIFIYHHHHYLMIIIIINRP